MRLAVLSDVHGNLVALEAVLADVKVQGAPDLYWVLGDLAAFSPWPRETLERLRALPEVAFLQGNTDRYLVTGRRPEQPVHSAEDWARLPAVLTARRQFPLGRRATWLRGVSLPARPAGTAGDRRARLWAHCCLPRHLPGRRDQLAAHDT